MVGTLRRIALLPLAALLMACRPAGPEPAPLLPHPLYFLSDHSGSAQVWRLEVDGRTLAAVTAEHGGVTAYDVTNHGRLAYAGPDGLLHATGPESYEPYTAVDLAGRAWDEGTRITWVRWSPDGTRLAFVVQTPSDGLPDGVSPDDAAEADGLWLWPLGAEEPTQVLPNHPAGFGEKSARRILEAEWAPQGRLLLVRLQQGDVSCYGVVMLAPPYTLGALDPNPALTPLYGQVAWLPDGRALVRAGSIDGAPGDLAQVDRVSARVTPLLATQAEGLQVLCPQGLPDGWVGFLASAAGQDGPFQLHLGRQANGLFYYSVVNSHPLPRPLEAAWDAPGRALALVATPAGSDAHALYLVPLTQAPVLRLAPEHVNVSAPRWAK